MNRVQEFFSNITGASAVVSTLKEELEGLHESHEELTQSYEHLDGQNALLQRQLEDLDYLALFDLGPLAEIIPGIEGKHTLNRLRRMRQENPIAKQAIKLILRFTLGKGVSLVVAPDPAEKPERVPLGESPGDVPAHKTNGLYPGNKPNQPFPPLQRPRPQVSEAVTNLPPEVPAPQGSDDPLKAMIEAFWKDEDNQLALTNRNAMRDWLDAVATDGECFFIGFEDQSEPYLKLTYVPLEEITFIVYDPNNWRRPVYYKRVYNKQIWDSEANAYKLDPRAKNPVTTYYLDWRVKAEELDEINKAIKIPAAQKAPVEQRIKHSLINPLWTKKGCRGVSELYASREWVRVYREFMEDRAAINAAATSIAIKRKVKGGPAAVAQFQNKLGGLDVGLNQTAHPTDLGTLARPAAASVYDSNPAVDLEWMKVDTGAVNAKEDGRSILAAGGAGLGIFVHYFGDGGDANLATAQAMELPMVKTFEDWQQWTEDELRDICRWVIRVATDLENAAKQIDRVAGSFPPIISEDVVKYMTAWSQLVQNVAPGNRVVKSEAIKGALSVMQVPNIDQLMNQIEEEENNVEIQRQQQQAAMIEAMKTGLDNSANGNGGPKPPRNGSGQSLPPDVKMIAKGKPAPERNGPKPA